MFDEAAEQIGSALLGIAFIEFQQLLVGLTQAAGVDDRADHHREALGLFVVIQLDRYHPAEGHAQKLHWRIHIQPAQGLLEAHLHIARLAIIGGHGLIHAVVQGEHAFLGDGLDIGAVHRCAEGNPARQNR